MTSSITVWIDLDETIISSGVRQKPGSIQLAHETWATLRPGARESLEELRRLNYVRLITYASMRYASAACDAFGLGFAESDIVGQERWTSFLREQPSLKRSRDVLIEDEQSRTIIAKCRFIGIGRDRVVFVPAYTGRSDDVLAWVPERVARLLDRDKGTATRKA